MVGTNQDNTFGEGLHKLMKEIAKMKMTPDADLDTLAQLEAIIIGKSRAPQDQASMVGDSALPMGPMSGPGAMTGGQMSSMGGPAPSPFAGPPPPGLSPGSPPGMADELTRMLSQ